MPTEVGFVTLFLPGGEAVCFLACLVPGSRESLLAATAFDLGGDFCDSERITSFKVFTEGLGIGGAAGFSTGAGDMIGLSSVGASSIDNAGGSGFEDTRGEDGISWGDTVDLVVRPESTSRSWDCMIGGGGECWAVGGGDMLAEEDNTLADFLVFCASLISGVARPESSLVLRRREPGSSDGWPLLFRFELKPASDVLLLAVPDLVRAVDRFGEPGPFSGGDRDNL